MATSFRSASASAASPIAPTSATFRRRPPQRLARARCAGHRRAAVQDRIRAICRSAEALDWIERLKPKQAVLTHMHVPLDYDDGDGRDAAECRPRIRWYDYRTCFIIKPCWSRFMDSMERVERAAAAAGLPIEIRRMGGSTRTAEDAAKACGCAVDRNRQVAGFRGRTERPSSSLSGVRRQHARPRQGGPACR